jgi:hypothetical protein
MKSDAFLRQESARDPDDLYGDATVFTIQIRVRRNGAMSVGGDVNNLVYALSVLDAAKDSLKSFHARRVLAGGNDLIIPAKDTPWDRAVA